MMNMIDSQGRAERPRNVLAGDHFTHPDVSKVPKCGGEGVRRRPVAKTLRWSHNADYGRPAQTMQQNGQQLDPREGERLGV
jgi:hypothetical protein